MKRRTGFLGKALSITLTAALAAGMLMGCKGGQEASGSTEVSGQSEASGQTSEASADKAENEGETVELIWYVGGNGPQADLNSVLEEVNSYLKDKINCTLKIIETEFGNYDQKMQMVIASQEKFDLCFTAGWSNNFYNNINKNAFLEIEDLADEYAPELKAAVPEAGWDAARVKGHLYAVPNMQIWAMTNGVSIVKEYVDKYNFDVSTVKDLKDLEPLLEAIKKDNPQMYPLALNKQGAMDFMALNMGYDELAGMHIPGAVMLEDTKLTALNQFEVPKVMDHYNRMYDWNKKGYFRQDAATLNDCLAELKAGMHAVRFLGTIKPGVEVSEKEIYGGKEVVIVPLSDSWLPTSGITATMTAISRTSEHPEKAMQFLNLLNTDPYLYNLITQGIEGKHYEKADDLYIKPIENSGYNPGADWMYGNQFLAYLKEGQQADDWEKTMELNESAKATPALGFVFDPTNVQNELASVSAVVKEYQISLDTGSVDPQKAMPEFLEKLDQAGSRTIIDEMQTQLDAWKAAE